jgi:hypothetical protein
MNAAAKLYELTHTYVVGKRAVSEDLVVVGRDLYAVVDGVPDKHGHSYSSSWSGARVTSGRFAAEVVGRALTQSQGQGVRAVVDFVTEKLCDAVEAQYLDLPKAALPGASFMAFIPSTGLLFGVGDCKAAWVAEEGVGSVHSRKEVDVVAASYRAAVIAANKWDGVGEDVRRRAILSLLETQANLANELGAWGYGLVNGTFVPDAYVFERTIAPARLVLATDGYPELHVDGVLGHAEAESRLEELKRADPLCVRELMGTKGLESGFSEFDDRAWLEIARRV